MAEISKITLPNGEAYDIRAGAIPYAQVDSTSTSTAYTATVPGISELVDGVCVLLKNGVVTSESGFTININGLGAKRVYSNLAAATADTTIFNVAYTMLFIYDSTRVSGGCWICFRGYDSNTNTIGYQLRTNSALRKTADKGYRYRLWFQTLDGTWAPANTSTATDATTARTPNTRVINPFGEIIYYSTNGTTNAGTNLTATTCWQQYVVALGYSFNTTGAALTLTSSAPVYVQCTPQAAGGVVINGYTQSLPSTKDGKVYIFLGMAYSATNIELFPVHPVYYYDGTGIRLWTGIQVPTKTSDLTNDSNFVVDANYVHTDNNLTDEAISNWNNKLDTQSDPTVPTWAKASTKPSYTFSELTTTPTSISGYGITDAYTKTEIDGLVSGVLHYKGTKATTGALPSSGNTIGDVWHITADGSEYAWDGSVWQELGTAVDLSGYVPTSRTVNGKALSADISLTASDVSALPSNTTYVSSFNGSSGAVTYTAPVTSVNGQTGAVTLNIPTVPTNVSDFQNDAGYLTSYTETDPTVPSWAKAANKPSYTASEVGALPSNTTYVSSFNGSSGAVTYTAPVTSVNGQTGEVSLTIPTVPTNVSAFTNDAGYLTTTDTAKVRIVPLTYYGRTDDGTDRSIYTSEETNNEVWTASQNGELVILNATKQYLYYVDNDRGVVDLRFEGTYFYAIPYKMNNEYTNYWALAYKIDNNTTYSLSISSNRITLTPSSGTATYVDLPIWDGSVT